VPRDDVDNGGNATDGGSSNGDVSGSPQEGNVTESDEDVSQTTLIIVILGATFVLLLFSGIVSMIIVSRRKKQGHRLDRHKRDSPKAFIGTKEPLHDLNPKDNSFMDNYPSHIDGGDMEQQFPKLGMGNSKQEEFKEEESIPEQEPVKEEEDEDVHSFDKSEAQ